MLRAPRPEAWMLLSVKVHTKPALLTRAAHCRCWLVQIGRMCEAVYPSRSMAPFCITRSELGLHAWPRVGLHPFCRMWNAGCNLKLIALQGTKLYKPKWSPTIGPGLPDDYLVSRTCWLAKRQPGAGLLLPIITWTCAALDDVINVCRLAAYLGRSLGHEGQSTMKYNEVQAMCDLPREFYTSTEVPRSGWSAFNLKIY